MSRSLSKSTEPDSGEFSLGPLEGTLSFLWIFVPLMSTVSTVSVALAIGTNQWLHTVERMPNPAYNGTGDSDREFLLKMTISGLWIFCYTNPGETMYQCNKIDYFSKEVYNPDPTDSTLAIPYTVIKSGLFFFVASALLIVAYVCCILGQCAKHRKICTFVSGILFILTGLLMLLGLIMYISIFKSETGSKLRPKSQLQPQMFEYSYGYSFLLYVGGLIATKISGIGCVFLFIYRIQYEWKRKQFEEIKRGKRPQTIPHFNNLDHTMYYPCRRHPHAYINSNSAIHFPPSPAQKRYYFSKEPLSQDSPCSLHHSNLPHSNSTKDLSTFYDFPPPPTISYHFDESLANRERPFPRDVTLNTVSTSADVNCDDLADPFFDDYSPSQHEFVTFDLDRPLSVRAPSVVSINSRNGPTNRKAAFEGDSLRRTTPV